MFVYLRICKRKHKLGENGEKVKMPIALIKRFNYAFYCHPFNTINYVGYELSHFNLSDKQSTRCLMATKTLAMLLPGCHHL